MPNGRAVLLAAQCQELNLPLTRLPWAAAAIPSGRRKWDDGTGHAVDPELVVLADRHRHGFSGVWCEGGTLNILMKAASLPFLIENNSFNEPQDAVRRYFEAQCAILYERRAALLDSIATASATAVRTHATRILADPFVASVYRAVTLDVVCELFDSLGSKTLLSIVEIFTKAPYDYRAGWPDLTLLKDGQTRWVEVKTSDKIHDSQARIVRAFRDPLKLTFEVVQVVAACSP